MSFGVFSGAYALMMVIPSDLLGMRNFSLAYGIMLAGEGIGVYLGPPLVGKFANSYLCTPVLESVLISVHLYICTFSESDR